MSDSIQQNQKRRHMRSRTQSVSVAAVLMLVRYHHVGGRIMPIREKLYDSPSSCNVVMSLAFSPDHHVLDGSFEVLALTYISNMPTSTNRAGRYRRDVTKETVNPENLKLGQPDSSPTTIEVHDTTPLRPRLSRSTEPTHPPHANPPPRPTCLG